MPLPHLIGYKHSDATRRKIGLANKGHNVSREARLKISNANRKATLLRWEDPIYRQHMSDVHKGHVHSEEQKRKQGLSNIGKHSNPETGRKISQTLKKMKHGVGKRLSDETKRKIGEAQKKYKKTELHRLHLSQSHKGKKLSQSHRQACSDAQKRMGTIPPSRRGCIPWNYRGATPLAEAIRKTFEYRQWRSDVFKRDGFRCQRCGINGKIEAHHIKPFVQILIENRIMSIAQAIDCAELWDINNGVTVCSPCHKSIPRDTANK